MKIARETELLGTLSTVLPQARRALVFAPHPDDEIFGCGGTLCLLRDAGAEVQLHILTDGAQGGGNDDGTLPARRREESCAAAAASGLPAPHFWGLPDRGLLYGEELVARLLDTVRRAAADLVFLPSLAEPHPDHQTLALAGTEALRRLGGEVRVAYYEVVAPLPAPTLLLDITAVAPRKQQAMACFASQLEQHPYQARVNGLNAFRGTLLGPAADYAEAFSVAVAGELGQPLARLLEGPLASRRRFGFVAGTEDLPLVSVIIRSMDRDTLPRALESVAVQTYPHIEVVLVNARGAGHGDPGELCGHFPLRLVDDGMRPCPRSRAANLGLDSALGSYCLFLDDDDWFLPHHVAALVAAFAENPAFPAVYSSVRCVDGRGDVVRIFSDDYDPVRLHLENFIPINSLLFRRDLIAAGARFDEGLDVCEDWDFWLQLAALGPFRFLPEEGAVYCLDDALGSGVWGDAQRTREVMTKVYRKWLPVWNDRTLWAVFDQARSFRNDLRVGQFLREKGFLGNDLQALADDVLRREALLEEEVSRLTAAVADAEAGKEALRRELSSAYASKSWKSTAPLRWLGRMARRLG